MPAGTPLLVQSLALRRVSRTDPQPLRLSRVVRDSTPMTRPHTQRIQNGGRECAPGCAASYGGGALAPHLPQRRERKQGNTGSLEKRGTTPDSIERCHRLVLHQQERQVCTALGSRPAHICNFITLLPPRQAESTMAARGGQPEQRRSGAAA